MKLKKCDICGLEPDTVDQTYDVFMTAVGTVNNVQCFVTVWVDIDDDSHVVSLHICSECIGSAPLKTILESTLTDKFLKKLRKEVA